MAACQVIQKHGDADVALSKYRIIYGRKPECAQVWNNIGMCFFSKKKFVAAVSCLKRANYLAPFELYILYNLALVHLYLQQNASAAIFLQSAIRINKKHALSYALLGVALSKLNDFDNALRAFTYSLKLDPTDPMTLLNLAILQMNTGVSQSKIDTTLKQFHQYYAEKVNSTNQHEIDKSMLDIATRLGVPPPISAQHHEEVIALSTSIFSPRKLVNEEALISSKQSSRELSPVQTKNSDDGKHKQRRTKHQPIASSDTESVQNEHSEFMF
jgi:tetratricopeptide (TPR) repeat protein